MSGSKFFAENVNPPRVLTEHERQHNFDHGLLALSRQIDAMQQQLHTLEQRLQQLEHIARQLR
jgi:ubiquinone biosynthesis protein UbiJ